MTEEVQQQPNPGLPTPVDRPAPTVWGAVGDKGDRFSTRYGGPNYSGPTGSGPTNAWSGQQRVTGAERDPNLLTREEASPIGKTNIGGLLSPDVPSPVVPEDLQAPERKPGFAEGMLGGLAQFFTGIFGDSPIREGIVRGAELTGEALDIPLGVLDHIPINQLLGLDDVKGAFKMMPMTAEKRRVIQAMTADPTEADYYMTQYLRAYAGDYAAAKEMPQLLAHVIRPDANPVERLLMLLGVPSQFVARNVAGAFGRVDELMSRDVSGDPALSALKTRYLNAEFGTPGTDEAKERLLDEMVTAGYGWGDDPFISMVAEMVTDPIIWASFGTGLALGAVRTGALATRASNVARLARAGAYASDDIVKAAVQRVDDLIKVQNTKTKNPMDLRDLNSTKHWSDLLEGELGKGHKLFDEATDMLKRPEPGENIGQARAYRRWAAYKMRRPIEAAAGISRALNEPLRMFGVDKAGRAIQEKWMRRSTEGAFAAFDYGKVYNVFNQVGADTRVLEEAMGYAIAHSQKSLMKTNLVKLVRTSINRGRDKFADHQKMPYALTNPEEALERARIDGHPLEAQEMQKAVEQWKKQYVPDNLPEDPVARQQSHERQMDQFRRDAAKKFAHAAGVDLGTATRIFKGADADMLAFADYVHWGRTIKDFAEARRRAKSVLRRAVDDALAAQKRHPKGSAEWERQDALVKEAHSDLEIASRSTLVGPNELTQDRAIALQKAMADAKDDAERLRVIEQAINQYEYIWENLYENARITSDADLIHRMNTLIDEGLEENRFVKTLSDDSLPPEMVRLKQDLRARGADYEIGLAPDHDKRWAPIYDNERNLIGYRPWMDVEVDPSDVKAPTRFDMLRERLTAPIRGENIMRKAQQRFVGRAAKNHGLSRGASLRLWSAVKEAARDRNITMRGFSPHEFNIIVEKVNLSQHDKAMLGKRGLADLVAHAMEGELKQVGLTTKMSGVGKTKTVRFGNYLGRLSETLYPQLRFNMNPFFLAQEFIEPYFFNVLRGVKLGFKWNEESLRTHNLIDEFNMADRLADGYESREMMMHGAIAAKNAAGKGTPVAEVMDGLPYGGVYTPKRVNYMNTLRRQFGDYLYEAFEQMEQGSWVKIEAHYNELEGRTLTRGEVAERWFKHRGLFDPDNQWSAIHHYDGAVPDQYGRIRGLNVSYLAKQFGFSDGAALRAAAADPLNPRVSEWKFRNDLVMEGASADYAKRAWEVVTGPSVEDVLDGFEGAYKQQGIDFHRDLAEAILSRAAVSKGISLDEYIARKFYMKPRWVDRNARLPLNAFTQLVDRMADEFEMPPIREGEFYDGMMARSQTMLPGRDAIHDTQQGHVNAARALASGFTYVDEITETVPPAYLGNNVQRGNKLDMDKVNALAEDMKERGYVGDDPIQITYYAGDRTAVIGEGNHRLAAARKARLDEVPVTVIRYEGNGLERVQGRLKPKKVRGIDPNEDGYTPGNMRPSQILEGTGKPAKSSKRVAKDRSVEGFELFTDGPTVEDFTRITSELLSDDDIRGVSKWYPEVAPVIAGIAKQMDDQTVRAFAEALNESNIKLGVDIEVPELIDDAVRQEIGARMLMAWAATQVQTSPRDGFQYTMAVLDRVQNSQRVGAKGVGAFSNQKAQFAAMLSDLSGFLNKEGVPTNAKGELNIDGLGAKLHDFIDSLLGNTEQRSFIRGREQFFTRRDGTVVPMAPGAMDIWMGRDFGFVDAPLLGYLKDRIKSKRGLSEEDAMTAAQLETGFFYKKKATKEVWDEDEGKMVKKQVDEPAEDYRARKVKWEKAHKKELKEAGFETLQEVWSGSPSAADYEAMLLHYNKLADELNSMNDGDGWLGRGYNNDKWTVADVQAVAWMRIQAQLGIDPGGPNNMFYQNSAQVSFEVLPGSGTPLGKAVNMANATHDAKDLITSEVMQSLMPIIEEATGVQVRKSVPGMGGWRDGEGEYTLSPNTYWEILGSPEAIDDALDTIMFLTQNDQIFATQTVFRTGGSTVDVSGKDNFWALDFAPSDDHPLTLNNLAKYLEANGIQWNGHMVAGKPDSGNVVRTVYSPPFADMPEGYRIIPEGTDIDGIREMTALPAEVQAKLDDGSWAREVGMDMDVPVTTDHQLVRSRSRESNFVEDADRAEARTDFKTDPSTAYKEELGKGILDGLRARGRGDLADALVSRYMDASLSIYDAALQRYDGAAWADGRGRQQLREAYRTQSGDAGEPHFQRGAQRVWNGATRWNRDVDAAQRIIGGKAALSGRKGEIVFREGRADITTVPHELFHIYADDLDPSAVRTIHAAFFDSDSGKRYLQRGGTKPTGDGANNHLMREAEEWAAAEFERWLSTGVAPNGTMNAAFNDYADWYSTHKMFTDPDPALDETFNKMNPELHRGQKATYDVDEYRFMEAARVALLRAEEEAFRVHYYKRGRTLLERSLNHPYLGLYPASYMWGKVLPEMLRFLVKKPFGVDAPLAGLAMANHVYEAIQLELNTDEGLLADFVAEYPQLARFIQLMVPGTPWDIPVNTPAWTRRLAQSSYTGQKADLPGVLSDTLSYAAGPMKAPEQFGDVLSDMLDLTSDTYQKLSGTYVSEEEQEAREENVKALRGLGATVTPSQPATYLTPRE